MTTTHTRSKTYHENRFLLHTVKEIPIKELQLAQCLELSDEDFSHLIATVESDDNFIRLHTPEYPEDKIIGFKPFPQVRLSPLFYKHIHVSADTAHLHNIFQRIIQQIGIERFMYFFISDDAALTPAQIAANIGVPVDIILAVQSYVAHAHLASTVVGELAWETYVTTEKREEQRFVLECYSPYLARGMYTINMSKLETFYNRISTEKQMLIKRIVRIIELINLRKILLSKMIFQLSVFQEKFCLTGDITLRLPLSQSTMADALNIDKSIICRIIRNKTISINNNIVSLKDFFPSRKCIILSKIDHIIKQERRATTDDAIRKRLLSKFRISLSRRSISAYRKSLSIPSSHKR